MTDPKKPPMPDQPFRRVERPATPEERARHAAQRQQIEAEFPPAPGAGREPSPPGIPSQIRQAREAQGLTWNALAKRAGVSTANAVRDVEAGRDAPLSTVQALARALGLRLELVEEKV